MNPSFKAIGVWYQPVASLATWKSRGVTCLVGYEPQLSNGVPTVSLDQWCMAADAHGLKYIVQLDALNDADYKRPGLIGVLGPDEPDQDNASQISPQRLKAMADAVHARGQIFVVSFSYSDLDNHAQNTTGKPYPFAECAPFVDVSLEDCYVANLGVAGDPANLAGWPKGALAALKGYGFAHVGGFLETADCGETFPGSPRDQYARGPTVQEVETEAATIVSFPGSCLLCLFPQHTGPRPAPGLPNGGFAYDFTPPDVAAALPRILGITSWALDPLPTFAPPPPPPPPAPSLADVIAAIARVEAAVQALASAKPAPPPVPVVVPAGRPGRPPPQV